jgi:hypothetical protein
MVLLARLATWGPLEKPTPNRVIVGHQEPSARVTISSGFDRCPAVRTPYSDNAVPCSLRSSERAQALTMNGVTVSDRNRGDFRRSAAPSVTWRLTVKRASWSVPTSINSTALLSGVNGSPVPEVPWPSKCISRWPASNTVSVFLCRLTPDEFAVHLGLHRCA